MNPFALSGPAFLTFFFSAALAAALAGLVLAWRTARSPLYADPAELMRRLHPTEVAFLLRGMGRAAEAAIAGLHHRGAIEVGADGVLRHADERNERGRAVRAEGVFRGAAADERYAPVETFVLARLPAPASEVCRAAETSYLPAALTAKLADEGLLVADPERARWVVRLPALAWIALGAIKLLVGISRDRPVSFLLMMLVAGGVVLFKLARAPWRTRLGDAVAKELEDAHHGLGATAQTAPQQLTGPEMTLAYAIFGYAAAAAALMALMPSYQVALIAAAGGTAAAGGSSCGSSSCGSSCGGGCGGGCGGCS